MRNVSVEIWECGGCNVVVTADALFAWCDGCAQVMCTKCLDDATTCDDCDTIVCRHCDIRFFAFECSACGVALHTGCAKRMKNPDAHAKCGPCAKAPSPSAA
jgi:hypothetical protein